MVAADAKPTLTPTPSIMLFVALLLAQPHNHPHKGAVEPCTAGGHAKHCCGDGICNGAEDINTCMADCPGVTTSETCGEEPHSDRGGKTLTFGVSHRTTSAQECCDRCTAHAGKNHKKQPMQ